MGFADLLDEVGGLGRYQLIHITLLSIPSLLLAGQNVLNNFTAGTPAHHCTIPNLTSTLNLSVSEEDELTLLRAFIPEVKSQLSKCNRYVQPQWHLAGGNHSHSATLNLTEVETESCVDGWTYKRTEFISTIVSEWDLVCSLHPLKQMSQTIYMGGLLAGAVIFGRLSDRFGRKVILTWSYFQLAVLGTFTALSHSYLVYCIFRFLTGMAISGIILNTLSFMVEWIPTKTRTLVVFFSSLCSGFGQTVLAGIAYSLKDWRKLHITLCSPIFIVFLYSWRLSESARWLVLNGRLDEALQQLHRVARINGKHEAVEKITPEVLQSHMQKELQSSETVSMVYDLLRTPVIRRISLCLVVIWFSTSFAYYGLAMDLQKFGVNIYLMQVIFGLVDFPAKLMALFMLNFLGRPLTQATCLLSSAFLIFISIFIPKDMQIMRVMLAVLGKGFTSASFTCVYLFTGELYPTVIRQTGMGFASTMARIGSMAAPAILILDEVFPVLPSIVYGAAAVIAGVIAFLLPETRDVPLPDTIKDVEEKRVVPDDQQKSELKTVSSCEEQVQHKNVVLITFRQTAEERVLLLFMANGGLSAGSTSELLSCCFEEFPNGSVVYRLNDTVESTHTNWNTGTPIKDARGQENKSIVEGSGENWIRLNRNISGINFRWEHRDLKVGVIWEMLIVWLKTLARPLPLCLELVSLWSSSLAASSSGRQNVTGKSLSSRRFPSQPRD